MTYTVTDLGRDGWSVYNAATRSEVRVRGPQAADIDVPVGEREAAR